MKACPEALLLHIMSLCFKHGETPIIGVSLGMPNLGLPLMIMILAEQHRSSEPVSTVHVFKVCWQQFAIIAIQTSEAGHEVLAGPGGACKTALKAECPIIKTLYLIYKTQHLFSGPGLHADIKQGRLDSVGLLPCLMSA